MKINLNLVEESLFLAKKLLYQSIYIGVKLEGSNITFPETQTILYGVNVPSVSLDDIQTIFNLRDAWKFVLNDIDSEINLDYICKVNSYVDRINNRVSKSDHGILVDVVCKRFKDLTKVISLYDEVYVYDNTNGFVEVATFVQGDFP